MFAVDPNSQLTYCLQIGLLLSVKTTLSIHILVQKLDSSDVTRLHIGLFVDYISGCETITTLYTCLPTTSV